MLETNKPSVTMPQIMEKFYGVKDTSVHDGITGIVVGILASGLGIGLVFLFKSANPLTIKILVGMSMSVYCIGGIALTIIGIYECYVNLKILNEEEVREKCTKIINNAHESFKIEKTQIENQLSETRAQLTKLENQNEQFETRRTMYIANFDKIQQSLLKQPIA